MSKLMTSVSGVRGVYGETLTPDIALRYAAHFGIMQERGKIIIGRDSRRTGPAMLHAVVSGLMSVGCEVIDLGIVPTPTVLLAVEESDATGGICITASHNPAQWNAMKFVDSNGLFLYPEKAQKFLAMIDTPIYYAEWDHMGSFAHDDQAIRRHIDKILAVPYIDIDAIRERNFSVAIDCVNGAGGVMANELLKQLNCRIMEINCEQTGIFAHPPEPLNENLAQIEDAVRLGICDIGFATDPDADRLSIINEDGQAIGEEFSLLLAESFILSHKKGDIVTNLSSSMASEDIAEKHGVKVHRTKVGEINVGKLMKEIQSPVGGEGNGGIICPDVHYTRDAFIGMALILSYMAQTDRKISELANEIPRYYFGKMKIEVAPDMLDPVMQKAERIYAEMKLDHTDGLKIIGDDYWVHIRKSGTEPIIRVYAESESPERSIELCKSTIKELTE